MWGRRSAFEASGWRGGVRAALAATITATALALVPVRAQAADATQLVRAAFDNWRANSSVAVMTMTVHRPSWERHMTMKGYTQGDEKALVRFTAPAKDAGNATLKVGNQTWVFNPKLNQVIRLPGSMMAQSWMGSDFSYNDLSKAEDLLNLYTHKIIATGSAGGHTVYTIEAIPKPGAPVVWGKQVAKVRDDGVFMEETFYDQNMQPVRVMKVDRIAPMGGRNYPVQITMHPTTKPGQWTRIVTEQAQFNVSLPGYLFTRSNLQNPRDK
jgi:outer membrane lipoprotein-sorting protein